MTHWKLRRYGAARKRAKQMQAIAAKRRLRVAQLLLEGHSQADISRLLLADGWPASYTTVKKDVRHIRAQVHQGQPCPVCGRRLPPGATPKQTTNINAGT